MIEERGAMVYGIIQEVAMVDQEVWLSMEGGVGIPADDLLGLGQPGG